MTKPLTTAVLIASTLSQLSFAATWSGANADWSNAAEWGGSVPGPSDTAVINAGTVTVSTDETVNATQIGFGAYADGSVVIDHGGWLTVNHDSNWGQSTGATAALIIMPGGRFDSIGIIDGFTGGATGMTITMEGGQFSTRNNFNADRGAPLTWDLQGGVVSMQRVELMPDSTMTFAGTSILAAGEIGAAGRMTLITGNVTMTENSTQHFDIGGITQASHLVFQDAPGTYDLLNMRGSKLTLGGNLSVSLIDGFADSIQHSDSFTIILSGTLTGSYDNVAFGERITTEGNEGSFLVSKFGTQVRLTHWTAETSTVDQKRGHYVDIPEPKTYALLTGFTGLAFAALRRRRR